MERDKQSAYASLVKYLCLEQYMGYRVSGCSWEFEAASPGFVIIGHQARITSRDDRYRALVIGKPLTGEQVHYMKCRMSKTQSAVLGVRTNTSLQLVSNRLTGSVYGWSTNKDQYENGTASASDVTPWKAEDEVLLKADLKSNVLKVWSTAGAHPLSLSIPKLVDGKSYAFVALIFDSGGGLDLLPVSELDQQLLP